MNGKSKNEGIKIIADFKDRAIPLSNGGRDQDATRAPSRCVSQPIIAFADFRDQAEPIQKQEPDAGEPKKLAEDDEKAADMELAGISPVALLDWEDRLVQLVFQGRNYTQIAADLGMTPDHLRTRTNRLRRRIRSYFESRDVPKVDG